MKYSQIIHLINDAHDKDRLAYVRFDIANSVACNIDLAPYDDEGIEELCLRIQTIMLKRSDWPNMDTFTSNIQSLLDEGEYETPTEECIVTAYEMANSESR